MTTEQALDALNDLGARACFMDQADYEHENDKLMAIVAADPAQHDAYTVLWRLTHQELA